MRHTVPKNLWAKYEQLLGKHADPMRDHILDHVTRVTKSPSGDAILWDPDDVLLGNIMDHLAREKTFIRKSSSSLATYARQIERLEELTNRKPNFTGGRDGQTQGEAASS